MIVQAEPTDMLMVRYKLYFHQHRPDPEDAWVLTYLQEHGLEPRRELKEIHDDVPYTVLHFGQCYLGRHVEALGKLYQRGVEYTALTQYLLQVFRATDHPALQEAVASLDAAAQEAVATDMAAQLHEMARFEVTAEGDLQVHIDAAVVTAALQTR